MGIIFGLLLFIFNLIDALSTAHFVGVYGLDIELNPVVRAMMVYLGIPGWTIAKIFIGLYASLALTLAWEKLPLYPRIRGFTLFVVGLYGFLTVYHMVCFFTYSLKG